MVQRTGADGIDTPEFLARLSRGDQVAVGILFRECAGEMMDYLKKTRSRHGVGESEWWDVVQKVFVKFLAKPPELDPSRRIKPLLLTMLLNEARDQSRIRRRRVTREKAVQVQGLRKAAGAESAGSRLMAAEDRSVVEGKLAKMSPTDRQALDAFVEGGPDRHVSNLAAASGVSQGTAQMRFVRAKDRWATALGQDLPGKDAR